MLDLINQEIIANLKKDGRIGWGRLASIVGISRQALKKRVERLEYKQHILGYTIVTSHDTEDSPQRNDPLVKAFLRIRFAKGNDYFKLSPILATYDNAISAWAITGDWDSVVLVQARNTEMLSEIREIIVKTGGIDEIETEVILNERRFNA